MNPNRRFFQIHLSTAVVLMFVAGVLLWANVRADKLVARGGRSEWNKYGWPAGCALREVSSPEMDDGTRQYAGTKMEWDLSTLLVNALTALAIFTFVCVACEWRIRRYLPIHLSTAMVLMLVAGVLVWVNVRCRRFPNDGQNWGGYVTFDAGDSYRIVNHGYGWPCDAVTVMAYESSINGKIVDIVTPVKVWRVLGLIIDPMVVAVILVLVPAACEWRIRRRAERKANE